MRFSGTVSEVVPKNPLDVSKTSFHVPTTTLGVSNTRSGWSRNSEFGYRIGGLGGPNTRLLIHPFRVCMYMCCSAKSFGNDVSGFGFRDGFVFRIRDGSGIRDSGWLRVLDSGFGYRIRGVGGPDARLYIHPFRVGDLRMVSGSVFDTLLRVPDTSVGVPNTPLGVSNPHL